MNDSFILCVVLSTTVAVAGCSKTSTDPNPREQTVAEAEPVKGLAEATPSIPIGCALAKKCGDASVAARAPWSGHGRELIAAAEQGDDAACNEGVFKMLHAAKLNPAAGAPPAACHADIEVLFEAVGRPFEWCKLLAQCGDDLATIGDTYAQESFLAKDVAAQAIASGKFSGERICSQTWDTLLEKGATNLDAWPKSCGGRKG